MSDQCALDKSGGLEEAEDIEFFFSESETMPLRTSTSTQATSSKQNSGNTGESYSIQVISCSCVSQGSNMVNGRRT